MAIADVMTTAQTDSAGQASASFKPIISDGPSIAVSEDASKGRLLHVDANLAAEEHLRFADFHEQYTGKYIELADAKAGATFAVSAGILAYLLNKQTILDILKKHPLDFNFALVVCVIIALALSAALAFWVVAPRRASSKSDGFVFWGTVAQLPSASAFEKRVTDANKSEITMARLSHCFDLSRVCAKKYSLLIWSMRSGLLGVLLSFVAILIV